MTALGFFLHGGITGAAVKTARVLVGQEDARVRDTFFFRGLKFDPSDPAASRSGSWSLSIRRLVHGGSQLFALPLAIWRSLILSPTCWSLVVHSVLRQIRYGSAPGIATGAQ